MAKISYNEYIKKSSVSVLLAEIIFSYLSKKYQKRTIAEIAHTFSGGTPNRQIPYYYNGNIPWLKSGELNDSYIDNAEEYITEAGLNNSSARLLPKGTLLVAMYGATAGKTGILNIESTTNQAICAIIPKDNNISKDFLYWFFRSYRYKYISMSRGGAQPNISQAVIKNTKIPLPDKNVQNTICKFLYSSEKNEINFSLINSELRLLINKVFHSKNFLINFDSELDRQQSLLKKLRQAILQEAVEGKLTAAWRKQHPDLISGENHAARLLEKIKAEKKVLTKNTKGTKKFKELPSISEDEKPFDLPEGWVWCRLGDLIQISSGDGLTSKEMVSDGNIPVYGGNGITGYHNIANVYQPTIVIGRVGAQCGAVYLTTTDAWVTDNAFITSYPKKLLNLYWLLKMLISLNLRKNARETAQPVISGKRVYPVIVGLPPFAEQKVIVEKVDRLMTKIDALEEQAKEHKAQAEQLMQAVLREAFNGEK